MSGKDYFLEHAVPNFFFHPVTAYAILRHNGGDVGKRDFLGTLSLRAPCGGGSAGDPIACTIL